MILKESKKDLFALPEDYSLAHCIGYDCIANNRISGAFYARFPSMKNTLIKYIKKNNKPFRPCAIAIKNNNRYIFNLITKDNYYQKSTYSYIRESLEEVRELCIRLKIVKIAMPKIGYDSDNLEWFKIKEILKYVFKDTNIEIIICKM